MKLLNKKFSRKSSPGKLILRQQKEAREAYERCQLLDDDSSKSEAFRLRIAMRCRSFLDMAFVAGARDFERFSIEWAGSAEPANELPRAKEYYNARSTQGRIVTWVPYQFTEKMYELGRNYQIMEVSKEQALGAGQSIANEVAGDLNLGFEFEVLKFLSEEEAAESD